MLDVIGEHRLNKLGDWSRCRHTFMKTAYAYVGKAGDQKIAFTRK